MYENFFGLTEKPFSIQPDPAFLYWGRGHRLAYAMLEYGVLNHAGISVITGEVGCGKTTLVHRLLDQLSDTHTVALISNIQAGRGDLLSWVLMGFGQPFAEKSHVELFAQLQSFFISEYAKGKRIVLIIDEAQNLSIDMLEELRMLSNINAGKDQLLQLILVGQPQLKDLLNRPEMLQLAQRVGSDFHLTPLNHQEVQAYLDTRLTIAGCRRRVFTDRAVDLTAEQSRGVPRVINIIADTALVYAFSAGDLVVGVETIRSVIRDKMDYGVFGLASDKNGAPPVKAATHKGLNAFIGKSPEGETAPAALAPKEDNAPYVPPENHQSAGDAATNASVAPAVQAAPDSGDAVEQVQEVEQAENIAVPSVFTVADLKTTVRTQIEEIPVAVTETALEAAPKHRSEDTEKSAVTGVVVIGARKNASPEAAIRAVGDGRAIVFVAAGDNVDEIAIARRAGAIIVAPGERPYKTGGRARNAGYRQLKKIAPHMRYVQFINADTALDPDWLSIAEGFMERRPEVALIEGQRRNRQGESVHYARLKDKQLLEAEGEVHCVRSAALVRAENFEAVGGFRGDLITAETKDLCVRMRRRGSHIWRLNSPMLLCMFKAKKFGAWWRERVEAGFENAYSASLHGGPPERLGVMETARALVWGLLFPVGIFMAAVIGAAGASFFAPLTPAVQVFAIVLFAGLAVYAGKVTASAVQRGIFSVVSWGGAFYAVLGAVPECRGVIRFWFGGKKPAPSL